MGPHPPPTPSLLLHCPSGLLLDPSHQCTAHSPTQHLGLGCKQSYSSHFTSLCTDSSRGEGRGSGRKKNSHLKCLLHLFKGWGCSARSQGIPSAEVEGSSPRKSQACVWYDWFLSDSDSDPTVVAHFEELFLEAGAVRCWSAERLVSPLLLASCFPEYRDWCQVKSEVDPHGLLGSGYVQGTLTLDHK